MDVRDRTAIVTGAGSGIGRATALALAREGARVIAADIDETTAGETAQLITDAGGIGRSRRVDVTDEADIQALLAFTEEVFGGLDILHNNAGVTAGMAGFEAAPSARWQRTLDINLRGVLLGIYHALPALRRRGGGVIINTASLVGLTRLVTDPVYAATKAGIISVTRSLSGLQAEANIRVNCVCPGPVATGIIFRFLASASPTERAASQPAIQALLQQAGKAAILQPEDVAAGVLRLITDDSLNGCIYRIEAGREGELL